MEIRQLELADGTTTTSPTITAPVFAEVSTPSNPDSGTYKLYPKSDGNFYYLNSSGVEQQVGSGASGGGINYCANPNATTDIAGWTSSDTDFVISRNTTTPLRGDADFKITKAATDTNGNYVGYSFTIDSADLASMLTVSFDYLTSSNYTDDYVKVEIYDVTNAVTIQPVPYLLKKNSLSSTFQCEFQTAYNSSSYKLCIVSNSTNTTAFTINFTNVKISPTQMVYGVPTTDWIDFTPTFNAGSWTVSIAKWRRDGQDMLIKLAVTQNAAQTATGTVYKMTLPNSVSTNAPTSSVTNTIGLQSYNFVAGSGTVRGNHGGTMVVVCSSSTQLSFVETDYLHVGYNAWTGNQSTRGFAIGTSNETGSGDSGNAFGFSGEIRVPIIGWSSSAVMSSEADTRVVAARFNGATNSTTNTATTLIAFTTAQIDTHGGFNSSTGEYTCKVAGKYNIGGHWASDNAVTPTGVNSYAQYYVKVNSTLHRIGFFISQTTSAIYLTANGSIILDLNVGDVIGFYIGNSFGNTIPNWTNGYGYIERISGPTQIACQEKIYAEYSTNAGQSIANNTTAIVDFEDKTIDTHGAVTTGASWKFTAPKAGYYTVTARVFLNSSGTFSGSELGIFMLYKNNANKNEFNYKYPTSGEYYSEFYGTAKIYLLLGDYIDMRLYQSSGGSLSLNSGSTQNYIMIESL